VATILSLQSDMEVVGEALDGLQAVQIARKTKPDVVLLDLVMPRQDGLTTIPVLKEISPDTKILVLTVSPRAIESIRPSTRCPWIPRTDTDHSPGGT
jgi:DNA-binding NarL/FixJ family response regulator